MAKLNLDPIPDYIMRQIQQLAQQNQQSVHTQAIFLLKQALDNQDEPTHQQVDTLDDFTHQQIEAFKNANQRYIIVAWGIVITTAITLMVTLVLGMQ